MTSLWFTPYCVAPAPGPVFLSGRAADGVLRRHKRYNSRMFEEIMEGDLERECKEEVCDLEEAREVFEDDVATVRPLSHIVTSDGDQCSPRPCQNQGVCKDQIGSFTCTCPPNFTGSQCEIATAKRCDVNNGDCQHFCESVGTSGIKCACADGYKLSEGGLDCFPEVEFPCGRDGLTVISDASRRSLSVNWTTANATNATLHQNLSTSSAPPVSASASQAASSPSTEPPVAANASLVTRSRRGLTHWAYQHAGMQAVETEHEGTKRIVGGEDVAPGEIPWQVGLVAHAGGQLFCGGSILSELWVITAAHCLAEDQSFYVKAGEHDIYSREGREQNLEVEEKYRFPLYNAAVSLYNHDIALLRLQKPIRFSSMVLPICLGPQMFTKTLVQEGSPGTSSGWGRLRFQGATSSTLQKVVLPYVDRAECKDSSTDRITRYMFCAGYQDEAKDSCQGDSGGPYTNRYKDTWFLTGIVSWGEECAKKGKYGVYTRVSHYYRWIRKVMTSKNRMLALEPDEPDP
ncbi:Coagulation factor IX [Merluccius polli]|uniref:Coagulation factor IX n=1 Tax=Merluccius polli TaxID=89951 RepID=A0AA47P330_MERPO|nr:Coagulation factor IX [Merluccius polli]